MSAIQDVDAVAIVHARELRDVAVRIHEALLRGRAMLTREEAEGIVDSLREPVPLLPPAMETIEFTPDDPVPAEWETLRSALAQTVSMVSAAIEMTETGIMPKWVREIEAHFPDLEARKLWLARVSGYRDAGAQALRIIEHFEEQIDVVSAELAFSDDDGEECSVDDLRRELGH